MLRIKNILQNSLVHSTMIYGVTNALYTGLPLFLLPFLVTILKPEDYGNVELFRTISMVLIPILGFSTVQSISRYFYDLASEDFKKFVSSIQIFQFITSLFGASLLLLFSSFLDPVLEKIIFLAICHFFFSQFNESLLVIFRVNNQPKKYLIFRIINIVIELGLLGFLFFTVTNINWETRTLPIVFSSIIVAFLSFFQFRSDGYKIQFSLKFLKIALIYSSPLILHMLSGYVLNIGDRFFIKYYLTDKELGNYAVAYQIGVAVNFFYTSFNLAWTPTYFSWMKNHRYSQIKKVRNMVYLAIPALGIVTLFLWFIFKSLLLKNSQFEISNILVIVILIANIILSLYKFESNFYLYNKETKKLSIYTFISAIIAIIFNIVLIPKIGIMGAGISTLISISIIFILLMWNKKTDNEVV